MICQKRKFKHNNWKSSAFQGFHNLGKAVLSFPYQSCSLNFPWTMSCVAAGVGAVAVPLALSALDLATVCLDIFVFLFISLQCNNDQPDDTRVRRTSCISEWLLRTSAMLTIKGIHSQSRIWKLSRIWFCESFWFSKSQCFSNILTWMQLYAWNNFDRKHLVFMKLWYKNITQTLLSQQSLLHS